MSQYEMNEEDKLYDEFGNYIGPDLSDDSDHSSGSSADGSDESGWDEFAAHDATPSEPGLGPGPDPDSGQADESAALCTVPALSASAPEPAPVTASTSAVVLHEDKEYYRSAQDTYGSDVEIQIEEEDTQPLEQPMIAPIKEAVFELIESSLPRTTFKWAFVTALMDSPALIRNVALIGHLHHGKTSLLDMLVKETHVEHRERERSGAGRRKKQRHTLHATMRYTDSRKDEQQRGLSIKACPISLVLPDLRGKHWLLNCLDVPGHVNFSDERSAALRLVDGGVVVVDCAEGVLLGTRRAMKHALSHGVPLVVVLNKLDRLIIELRLPPRDAYLKLQHTLSELNDIVRQHSAAHSAESKSAAQPLLHPARGNVCFASSWFNWSFTLESFAQLYAQRSDLDAPILARKLWGDIYYDAETRAFVRKANSKSKVKVKPKRTFVQFVLEPLYKIYAHTLGCDASALRPLLRELGVSLSRKEQSLDAKPLLSVILSRFFGGGVGGLVTMLVRHVPSPVQGNAAKVERHYLGDSSHALYAPMTQCRSSGPAMVHVTKMYSRPNASKFDAFGRVFCGTLRVGDRVKVLREGYCPVAGGGMGGGDVEDMSECEVEAIWILQGRYRVEVNQVRAGNWALLGGVDGAITKTATLCSADAPRETHIFGALAFDTRSVCKVAIEPIKPSELPKMTHGLRCVNKAYPLLDTKVEESGEHVLCGPGELYLDCVLHDLRSMYACIEIKVSDPVVCFCESVQETSSMRCVAVTKNKRNRLAMTCEPLSARAAQHIAEGRVSMDWSPKQLAAFFAKEHGWDLLAGRNVWAFGPDARGPNILCDDTLGTRAWDAGVRGSLVQGFEWGVREGPLCDEPIRNCHFKLVDAELAEEAVWRGGGQLIPAARRAVYSSFMLASPRLMEPILFVEALCPPDCVSALEDVLGHRRGRVLKEMAKPGTPFVVVYAELPAIDSFGFETDLRSHTQGQAFCLQVFHRWDVVPGDPMDDSITLMPLEPHPPHKLAREFMVKTRKRKGLSDSVQYHTFFDESMHAQFAALYGE